jgi:peptidoglycan/xylan/chitin deacetylase (PgdA/CDA1 family)
VLEEQSVILCLHGVGPTAKVMEPGERRFWLGHPEFTNLLDFVADHRTEVSLTFDDGNASDFTRVLPELCRRDLTATFFVVAESVGKADMVTPDHLRMLADAGMDVGSHGLRHTDWRAVSSSMLMEELADARDTIQRLTGTPVTKAACPYGSYDRRVLRILREAHYEHIFTADGGPARRQAWVQDRYVVRAGEDIPSVVERLGALTGGLAGAGLRMRRIAKRIR